ncbi:CRISPR-associated protein Cas2 [Gammaproteobacteria bacterium]
MPDLAPQWQILCYDIADPKRLGRVHRYMVSQGIPLQYSVFLLRANKPQVQRILDRLSEIIDDRKDDIRVYPLPTEVDVVCLGRRQLAGAAQLEIAGLPRFFFDVDKTSDLSSQAPETSATGHAKGASS